MKTNNWNTLSTSTKNLVKQAILNAASNRKGPEGYKSYYDCLENIEFERRDGFIPNSDNCGGLTYRNFTDLMEYWSSGHNPAHIEANNEIKRQIDYWFKIISKDIYSDNKSLCLELNIGENECNYYSLQQFEETSELLKDDQRIQLTKMLNDIQEMESSRLSGEDSSIMHELRFMYHGVNNKGMHEASVSAAINTEGPYHRSSVSWMPGLFCEGAKEVTIKWKNNAELKRKLNKAFQVVSKAIF